MGVSMEATPPLLSSNVRNAAIPPMAANSTTGDILSRPTTLTIALAITAPPPETDRPEPITVMAPIVIRTSKAETYMSYPQAYSR